MLTMRAVLVCSSTISGSVSHTPGGSPARSIDVGGVRHKTTRSTLATGSGYFEARLNFDGKEEDGGALFVDRDGELFHYVLTHLRNNGLPRSVTDRLPADARARLVVEAEYYAMPALVEQLVVPPVGAAVRLRATDGPTRMPGLKPSTTMVFGKIAEYDHAGSVDRSHWSHTPPCTIGSACAAAAKQPKLEVDRKSTAAS